jgi:hypothetical protein
MTQMFVPKALVADCQLAATNKKSRQLSYSGHPEEDCSRSMDPWSVLLGLERGTDQWVHPADDRLGITADRLRYTAFRQ